MQHVPVDDDAGTDTGSHGNEYGTVTFFGGTLPHLSIHIAGTVAVDVYLDARRRYTAQLLIEGVVVPARYVGGPYPVGLGVNDTGDADTYSVDVYTASACYGKKFGEDIRGELAHFVTGSSFQEPFAVKHHASVRKENGAGYFCAAYVQCDCCHGVIVFIG